MYGTPGMPVIAVLSCTAHTNRPMDRLGNLEAFTAAADLRSFTKAAQRLRISPSALGRRIAQLEEELGVRLFYRTTRSVSLTEEGRLFHERSRGALQQLQAARTALTALREKPAGRLRVEAPTMLGRHVLVPRLSRFLAEHPEIEVELSLRDHPSNQVAKGIDVALRMGPLEDSGLVSRRLGASRLCIFAAPSYLERKGVPRTLDDLEHHDLLALAPEGRPIPWRLRDGESVREIVPRSRLALDDAHALIALAVGGAGLAWGCEIMMAEARRAGLLVEVLEHSASEHLVVHALSHPTRHVLPKIRAFSDFAAAALEAIACGAASRNRD